MAKLEVVQPGMLSLIQDVGRFGVAQLGLSQGGPVDLHAFSWANHLLGNAQSCPVIEITLGQAAFKAREDTMIALTGADMMASVDGKPQPGWRAFWLRKGQLLKFSFASSGLRAYLAVAGGFTAQKVFGSSATVVRNKLGGLTRGDEGFGRGHKLAAGDLLATEGDNQSPKVCHSVPRRFIPDYDNHFDIGVIESYQIESFSPSARKRFFQSAYTVSQQSDRMGVRLSGEALACQSAGIISEGIALGAIQIPADGQPIVLLNDRQTLGGYPKIGCVSRIDLPKIAQAKPGTVIRFYRADVEEKSAQWCQFSRFFNL